MTDRAAHLAQLRSEYHHVETFGDGEYVAYYRLMFHWTMIRGHLDITWGYGDRWCYGSDPGDVTQRFAEWKARGFEGEPEGWTRHPKSGRRRVEGDPATEYVAW